MACEMFWMEAEELPPAVKPKRKAARAGDSFACDVPEAEATTPKASKPGVRKARAPKTIKVSAARE
ncbi:MAG TPA: hypothetical protein VGJ01_24990 [Pseudolabrys sp.]|jgi:hypothetical protein